jgi:hypothetical protein
MVLGEFNMGHQILNVEQHGNLKKVITHNFQHMQTQQLVQLNMYEFPAAGTCFPLFFIKDKKTAKLFPIALLGLGQGQNLYYSKEQWLASYLPVVMQSEPFSMMSLMDEDNTQQYKIAADLSSPYLSKTRGEPLFTDGQPSAFLTQMQQMLHNDNQQKLATLEFLGFLTEHNLIKPIRFELGFDDGEKQNIDGIYSIDESALGNLTSEQVLQAQQLDYFKAIYCMLGSQHNLYDLIKRSKATARQRVSSLEIVNI